MRTLVQASSPFVEPVARAGLRRRGGGEAPYDASWRLAGTASGEPALCGSPRPLRTQRRLPPYPARRDPAQRPPEKSAALAAALKAIDSGKPEVVTRCLVARGRPVRRCRDRAAHRGAKARVAVLDTGRWLAPLHPRLTGFMINDTAAKSPALAVAALKFALAARCDIPAVYAADALQHRSRDVRETLILAVAGQLTRHGAGGPWEDVMEHVRDKEKSPHLLALFCRICGQLGLNQSLVVVRPLTKHRHSLVRTEATVALARLTGALPAKQLRWLNSTKNAASYLRAAANVPTLSDVNHRTKLRRWRRSGVKLTDPLSLPAGVAPRWGDAASPPGWTL